MFQLSKKLVDFSGIKKREDDEVRASITVSGGKKKSLVYFRRCEQRAEEYSVASSERGSYVSVSTAGGLATGMLQAPSLPCPSGQAKGVRDPVTVDPGRVTCASKNAGVSTTTAVLIENKITTEGPEGEDGGAMAGMHELLQREEVNQIMLRADSGYQKLYRDAQKVLQVVSEKNEDGTSINKEKLEELSQQLMLPVLAYLIKGDSRAAEDRSTMEQLHNGVDKLQLEFNELRKKYWRKVC